MPSFLFVMFSLRVSSSFTGVIDMYGDGAWPRVLSIGLCSFLIHDTLAVTHRVLTLNYSTFHSAEHFLDKGDSSFSL